MRMERDGGSAFVLNAAFYYWQGYVTVMRTLPEWIAWAKDYLVSW